MHCKPLFVRTHNSPKKLTGKLCPEMIQKILQRTTHASMVVRGAQHNDVSLLDLLFQSCINLASESCLNVK